LGNIKWEDPMRFGRLLEFALAMFLALLRPAAASGSAGDCIDYQDYMQSAGSVVFSSEARSAVVSGSLVYVAAEEEGLQIIDVSDKYDPKVRGIVDTPGLARFVAVSNDLACVVDQDESFYVVDVSNPDSPAVLGELTALTPFGDVEMSGDHVFLAAADSGFHVVDISTPTLPTIVATVAMGGFVQDFAVRGSLVYVADLLSPARRLVVGRRRGRTRSS
jgi:hypothetical protein